MTKTASKSKSKTNTKTVKTPAPSAPTTATVETEETSETTAPTPQVKHEWGGKYAECTQCGGTERKHYSGGLCTRCYTEKRNEKLGLGTHNKETQARKAERLAERIARMEDQLKELKAQHESIQLRVA